jgi:hypothetical protein
LTGIAIPESGTSLADWALVATAVFAALVAAAVPVSAYWRRPKLRLTEEGAARHSHVEADGAGYLRLVVANARRKRAAHATRVVVEGYRAQAAAPGELRSLAHPSLGWPSAVEARADATVAAVTVYSGSGRPIELGRFIYARATSNGRLERRPTGSVVRYRPGGKVGGATWYLVLGLHDLDILDDRDKLPPDEWVIRLLVGAEDGDAKRYDVHVAWSADASSVRAVLDEALERLGVEAVSD